MMENADFYSRAAEQQLAIMDGAAAQALERWNMADAKMSLIKFRENAVYKLVHARGTKYALRVHRLGYHNDAELRSEMLWMQGMNEAGIPTPGFIPSANGTLFEKIPAKGIAQPFLVDVMTWAEGEPLGSIEEGISGDEAELAQVFHKIGTIAAKTHNWAQGWKQPRGFTRHAWDVDGLTGEQPFWGRFWELENLDNEQRVLLLAARDKLRSDLQAFGKSSDRYGLIHADFLPENFLVSDNGIHLIDFDDAGFGWHLFDLATTLFMHQGKPYFDAIKDALIAGYRTERELSEEQVGMLPMFLFARGTTNLGWAHTRDLPAEMEDLVPLIIELVCAQAEDFLKS